MGSFRKTLFSQCHGVAPRKRRNSEKSKRRKNNPIGFESGSFFGRCSYVKPFATSTCDISDRVRLVLEGDPETQKTQKRRNAERKATKARIGRGSFIHLENARGDRWKKDSERSGRGRITSYQVPITNGSAVGIRPLLTEQWHTLCSVTMPLQPPHEMKHRCKDDESPELS